VVAFYDVERHAHLRCVYGGVDPGVACLGHLSFILLHLGFLDAARRSAEECLALAERLGHPLSLAFGLWLPPWVNVWRGEHATARALFDRLLAVATEHRFPLIIAWAEIGRRWLEIERGVPDERQPVIHNWVAALDTTGYRTTRAVALVFSAEEHCRLGLSERALEILEEAQQQVERYDERISEPLLHLARGEILLDGRDTAEAEASFTTALEVARGQKAGLFELLAATALARLWQGQGKRREARELLRPVYDAFTEGLDTAPLSEARALLEEIEGG
jgi:tetratricopeptide (TPR) repeat protein